MASFHGTNSQPQAFMEPLVEIFFKNCTINNTVTADAQTPLISYSNSCPPIYRQTKLVSPYDRTFLQSCANWQGIFTPGIYCHVPQIAKFMGPTRGPIGSCRPQMDPMLASWTLLSGTIVFDSLYPSMLHIGVVSLSHSETSSRNGLFRSDKQYKSADCNVTLIIKVLNFSQNISVIKYTIQLQLASFSFVKMYVYGTIDSWNIAVQYNTILHTAQ